MAVSHAVNWLLVGVAERLVRTTPVGVIVNRLVPRTAAAASTYLALGLMGVALAAVYEEGGAWAVALLLLPLIGARQALRSARDLEESERERHALTDRLSIERERERVRIASDIHDVVLQRLAALQLHADTVTAALARADQDAAAGSALAVRDGAEQTIADLRDVISNMSRGALVPDGLPAALEELAATFQARHDLLVRLRLPDGTTDALRDDSAALLYESCREALTNVARHAKARSVEIALNAAPERVEISIRDDGIGCRPDSSAGLGLELLRAKLALAGGSLTMQSTERGTTVVATAPGVP